MTNHLFDTITSRIADPSRPLMLTDDGRRLTYADMLDETARMANALRALGVAPGDRVAVQADKSPEMIFLYLACVRAGAVFLPLNTGYTLAEVEYFVGDAAPSLIVCRPQTLEAMRGLGGKLGVRAVESLGAARDGTFHAHAAAVAASFADHRAGPDDLAAILYTSGTTGRSKGAMMSHDNLASNALTLAKMWRFTPADVLIHALPIYHTHGLFVATNVTLLAGASMIFQNKFDADAVMKAMPDATALMGVPTFYTRLLSHPGLTKAAAARMRLFVSGSAPLLAETHDAWAERTGHAILERYGMTETNMIASNPYEGERRAGTVGFALEGVDVRVADPDTGAALPQGGIGVIEVRGPNVFKGYWNMPEKTKAEFRADGYFITGDLALVDARGYIQIVGRAKDLIISGGFNVYPKEIESEIDAIPGVVESAVVGVPHPDFGEGVTAVVVRAPGASIDAKGIITALEGRLAKFKLPKAVFFADDLPRNAMGKVQKNVLRDEHKDLFAK